MLALIEGLTASVAPTILLVQRTPHSEVVTLSFDDHTSAVDAGVQILAAHPSATIQVC